MPMCVCALTHGGSGDEEREKEGTGQEGRGEEWGEERKGGEGRRKVDLLNE